ncbi:MAG: ABC transporter permease [Chloroflexi bacterium]|nr:ABC transporter permease [Chloroflexota bacterium]
MRSFLLRRLARALFALWGVTTLVFVVMHLSGDPTFLFIRQDAPPADIQRVRTDLGLEGSLPSQYFRWIGNVARGDFGRSIHARQPALALALERLPATLELALTSFLLAVAIAVPAGVLSAVRPHSIWDNLLMLAALIGQATPTFYVGILLILFFGLELGLFPISGRGTLSHLVLPSLTLSAFAIASLARVTRAAMLEVVRQDFVWVARSKGIPEATVVSRHMLRNAAIPIVTIMGIQFGTLLGGAVVTETVFAWPGIGRLAVQSITNRDFPVVQACVFLGATAFIFINLLVDLTYGWLDPRIRYS